MPAETPLPRNEEASGALETLLTPVDDKRFQSIIRRLHARFRVYSSGSPEPLPAPGLIVTPEIRIQSELYLPIADIAPPFKHLYAAALRHPPILSSTPFHNALSWADCFAALPAQFQFSADPARLLESLLADDALLTRFLFASFLPGRFYGGLGRYPAQQEFVREWLLTRKGGTLYCLDAACGTGEGAYALALMLSGRGFAPEEFRIDGWTLEPLEVWAATHRRFPHDRRRETMLRGATDALFRHGYGDSIRFRCRDILNLSPPPAVIRKNGGRGEKGYECYDLILCNGLLGGPIIHEKKELDRAVGNLAQLLVPGGMLLAADSFHGGWKQKCPQGELRASFETHRLQCVETGEGIGGLKPY